MLSTASDDRALKTLLVAGTSVSGGAPGWTNSKTNPSGSRIITARVLLRGRWVKTGPALVVSTTMPRSLTRANARSMSRTWIEKRVTPGS